MATNKSLGTADSVTSVQSTDSVFVEVGGSVRRITMSNFASPMGSELISSNYTLEGSSSPKFDVSSKFAVNRYTASMGGYMLKVSGGKVYAAKLNPSNWNYFEDGSAVDDASKYETMVHVPKCHFKASGKTMQLGGLSAIAGGHTFDSPEWVGAYLMYVDGSSIGHSRPDVSPAHSKTMSGFWSCAQKLGTDWGLANYQFHCLINALFQASYGNLNSQEAVGLGWQSSSWEACRNVAMGLTRTLGDGTGSVLYNDSTLGNQYPTKLFGFEDLWGKLWEFRPGIRFSYDSTTAVRTATVYSGNQVSNTASGRTFTCLSSAGEAYVSQMQLGEYWDMIPQAVSGSATTYYCDGAWAATGGQLLNVGGHAYGGLRCGVAYSASSNGFSLSWPSLGARLAFYGTPILVSGTELMAM